MLLQTKASKRPLVTGGSEKLLSHITKYGHGCWSSVPKLAGLQRCGKNCRLRWINYLRPDLKRGVFSHQEECLIVELHSVLGNRWSHIAAQLPERTDNEIKNLRKIVQRSAAAAVAEQSRGSGGEDVYNKSDLFKPGLRRYESSSTPSTSSSHFSGIRISSSRSSSQT